MKFLTLLAPLFLAACAHAGPRSPASGPMRTYLCSDGTRIMSDSQASVIYVTINDKQTECKLEDGPLPVIPPGKKACSKFSPPPCAGEPIEKECIDKSGEHGNCFPGFSNGADGKTSCICGVGE